MSDISVIILIGQEKIHLKRCIEKLKPLEPKKIWLIESQPDDGGVGIAKETAAEHGLVLESVYHKWPGMQSMQFNWALDNVVGGCSGSKSEWILRIDADEYLTEEGCKYLHKILPTLDETIAGLDFELKRRFMGGEIRHGTSGIMQTRLFRTGRGRYPESLMDERIVCEGAVLPIPVAFYDDCLQSLEWWKAKHRGYAKREAVQAISGGSPDGRKLVYYKYPRYFRAFAYFSLRYFVRLGFLDGLAGWRWHFWQGLWYRCLVDYEIGKLKRRLDTTKERLSKIAISAIILTKNEELHIARCLERLAPLRPVEFIIIDSGSNDKTEEIAKKTAESLGIPLRFVYHDWPGNQAAQFNWGLENLEIAAEWILRIDADEYLTEELVEEIKAGLPIDGCNGFILKRRHVVGWLGDKWIKRGMYPTKILRLFRKGTGKSNLREMDEHIDVEGVTRMLACDFVDHSLITFEEWREKHRAYAKREAKQWATGEWGNKAKYYRVPLYLRAIIYWAWRMFRKGAIWEGPKAWRWCWYHALWYRWQCDREIGKLIREGK